MSHSSGTAHWRRHGAWNECRPRTRLLRRRTHRHRRDSLRCRESAPRLPGRERDSDQLLGKIELRKILDLLFFQYDDAAKQPAVDRHADVSIVIMKRPCTDHLRVDLKCVDPRLTRTNLVGAPPVRALRTERKRAIGIDSVLKTMHMEAVRQHVG